MSICFAGEILLSNGGTGSACASPAMAGTPVDRPRLRVRIREGEPGGLVSTVQVRHGLDNDRGAPSISRQRAQASSMSLIVLAETRPSSPPRRAATGVLYHVDEVERRPNLVGVGCDPGGDDRRQTDFPQLIRRAPRGCPHRWYWRLAEDTQSAQRSARSNSTTSKGSARALSSFSNVRSSIQPSSRRP